MSGYSVHEMVRIEAPVSTVYAAWTSGEAMSAWFAPMAISPPTIEMEFRVGGRYRIEMDLGPGGVHLTEGEFLALENDARIVMSWRCSAWADPPSEVDIHFSPDGDATVISVRHQRITSEPAQEGQRFGWTACLGRLSEIHSNSINKE